jgi:hypothetical protein
MNLLNDGFGLRTFGIEEHQSFPKDACCRNANRLQDCDIEMNLSDPDLIAVLSGESVDTVLSVTVDSFHNRSVSGTMLAPTKPQQDASL